jgi:integrase
LRDGVNPKVISERLGHSRVAFTLDVYSHLLPGMQEEAARKTDSVLREALKKQREHRA